MLVSNFSHLNVGGHCKTLQHYNRLHQKSVTREFTIFQDSCLILCLVTIVGLSLLPAAFVHAKEQVANDVTKTRKRILILISCAFTMDITNCICDYYTVRALRFTGEK